MPSKSFQSGTVIDAPWLNDVNAHVFSKHHVASVRDFGALADGSNDQAAIQAALAASDVVYFPPGTYCVEGNINIVGKSLIGLDRRACTIKLLGQNTNTPLFVNSANATSPWGSGAGCTIKGLTLEGNWDLASPNLTNINDFASVGMLVKWYFGSYLSINDCVLKHSFGHAVGAWCLGYSWIQNCEISTNALNGLHLEGPDAANSVTSTWVTQNSIHSCRGVAQIYTKNCMTLQCTHNVLEDGANGFYSDGDHNRGVVFAFNQIEAMSGAAVFIAGSGTQYRVSDNFLGTPTPLRIANSLEYRQGIFTNNFNVPQSLDYTTNPIGLGSGATPDTAQNFFGAAVDGAATGRLGFRSNNNADSSPEVEIAGIHVGTVNQRGGRLVVRTTDPTNGELRNQLWVDDAGRVFADTDNAKSLGLATKRWSVLYAGTSTISTSDANEKTDIRALSEAEKRVALALKQNMRAYKFRDAVAAKGVGQARIHFGVTAQAVAAAFESEGLNPNHYGVFCADTWYQDANGETFETNVDAEGRRRADLTPVTRLGVRYDELMSFLMAVL